MQKYHGVVQDASGRAIGGASVTVLVSETQEPATVYADDESTVLTQPIIADGYGRHSFKAVNGAYDITAVYGQREITLRNVAIYDPSNAGIASGLIVISAKFDAMSRFAAFSLQFSSVNSITWNNPI